MENRDFRDRLRNHTREANPMAWEQMESLLDSVDENNKEKKKKRGLWWWFFGIIGIGLLGLVWIGINDNVSEGNLLSKNTDVNEKAFESTIVELESEKSSDTLKEVENSTINEENLNSEIDAGRLDDTQLEELEIEKLAKLNRNAEGNLMNGLDNPEAQNKRPSSQSELTDATTETEVSVSDIPNTIADFDASESEQDLQKDKEQRGKPIKENSTENTNLGTDVMEKTTSTGSSAREELTKNERDSENESNSDKGTDVLSRDTVFEFSKSIENSTDGLEVDESDNAKSDDIETRDVLLNLARLNAKNNKLEFGRDGMFEVPQIKIYKPLGISAFIGGGYALFNDNPGFFVSGGMTYDVDRILDLEVNMSYSYGSEQGIPAGELYTFERQFDFSLLIHLNIIKSERHKFALLGGFGRASYSGQRIIRGNQIFIDDRSSSGRTFQGGLDYKWRFKENRSIGIRAGFISYDDIVLYVSPRLSFEF